MRIKIMYKGLEKSDQRFLPFRRFIHYSIDLHIIFRCTEQKQKFFEKGLEFLKLPIIFPNCYNFTEILLKLPQISGISPIVKFCPDPESGPTHICWTIQAKTSSCNQAF